MKEGETSNLKYNILYCIYLPISLYYCLIFINDYLSNLIFFITLLTLTSVFKEKQRKLLVFQGLVTLADVTVKILVCLDILSFGNDIAVLDDHLVRIMLSPST